MKILNGFSFNMIPVFPTEVRAEEISLEKAREVASRGLESTVGHADTAAVYGQQLGVDVPAVRSTIFLQKGEVALIGSYRGPRMPEGTKELPASATIQWLLVTITMRKIIDSVSAAAAEKAAEATKEVLSGFKPAERLLLVGIALIGLAIVSADRETEKQKDSRKSH